MQKLLPHKLFLLLFIIVLLACNHDGKKSKSVVVPIAPITTVRIRIIPLGKQSSCFNQQTFSRIKQYVSNAVLERAEPMPKMAYYKPRDRYRADSIIHWLKGRAGNDEVIIGVTAQDISTTKDSHEDWGVMGLGYWPGKACVVSSHRVRNKSNFYKVILHEMGHNMGLDHCNVKMCFMRDAEGHDTTDEEKDFCEKCKGILRSKGWKV